MRIDDLFPEASGLNEVHYTDLMPANFDEFRKKYTKLAKGGQGNDLYVQFTMNPSDMDRGAWQTPDHSDFVGIYGYPLAYVLSHPADVWYGRAAQYLRVLQNTARRTLRINDITSEEQVISMLLKAGYDYRAATTIMGTYKKHYRDRLTGPNKLAKLLLGCLQIDLQSEPTKEKSWGKIKHSYRVRSGAEQTALLRKMGFDAIEDTSRNNSRAVINSREPEQICFLTRGAFRIVEVVPLRPGQREKHSQGMTYPTPDARAIERPFAQALAGMLGDRLKQGPERSSLNGWSYYWTQKGRRIEIAFNPQAGYYDNKKMGEKKHRADRLFDPHETSVVIQTEKGKIEGHYAASVKFKDVVTDLAQDWRGLVASPQQTDWTPQDAKGFEQWRIDQRRAAIQKKLDREKQHRLSKLPRFLADVKWAADHYGLPFTPPANEDLGETLMDICDTAVSVAERRNKTIADACAWARENEFGPAIESLLPTWDQITKIMEAGWADLANHEDFWWVSRGGHDCFQSMRRILKGQRAGGDAPDYEPVERVKAAA